MKNNTCGCGCHSYVPVLIILFALLFLLQSLGFVLAPIVSVVWPIILGLIGIAKLGQGRCNCC